MTTNTAPARTPFDYLREEMCYLEVKRNEATKARDAARKAERDKFKALKRAEAAFETAFEAANKAALTLERAENALSHAVDCYVAQRNADNL